MRILAIETIGRTGSVALLDDANVLAESQLDVERRSAQTLVPTIAEILARVAWSPNEVELVAVAIGPGSFTGLRIGVTTAKMFAYAVGCGAVGVPTLTAIACRAPADVDRYWVVLDAERGEVFAGEFERGGDQWPVERGSVTIVQAGDWIAGLAPNSVVTGPALGRLAGQLPRGVTVLDRALWSPTASAVGRLGWRLFCQGAPTNAIDLVPQYVRRTAAEEKRDAGAGPARSY